MGPLHGGDGAVMRPAVAAVFACLALHALAGAARAHAFSDRERFNQAASQGGGDDRLFTGAPRDGYACNVCHLGAEEPTVFVSGLPITGYVPGQTYDVEIAWTNATVSHALHVEIMDPDTGRAAGRVVLLDAAAVDARGRCGSLAGEDRADYLLQVNNRQILGVEGCGASSLRFRFTAPDSPSVVFAGSVVRAGEPKASPFGDGVMNLTRVVPRVGEPSRATSSCAVHAARGEQRAHWLWALALLTALLRARVRTRRNEKLHKPTLAQRIDICGASTLLLLSFGLGACEFTVRSGDGLVSDELRSSHQFGTLAPSADGMFGDAGMKLLSCNNPALFIQQVLPRFVERCVECHDGTKLKASFAFYLGDVTSTEPVEQKRACDLTLTTGAVADRLQSPILIEVDPARPDVEHEFKYENAASFSAYREAVMAWLMTE
jgi:hypothetical protein